MRNVQFNGMIPKVYAQSLPTNCAVLAENCLLHGGLIDPLRNPLPFTQAVDLDGRPQRTVKSLFVTEAMAIGFSTYTPVAFDILKRAGADSFLFVRDGKLHRSSPSWILDHQGPVEVGVCRPTEVPSYVYGGKCDPRFDISMGGCMDDVVGGEGCETEAEVYYLSFTYTYVTPCQEESAPAPYSQPTYFPADQAVLLFTPKNIPDNVVEVRWYALLTADGTSNAFYIGSVTPQELAFNYCHRYADFAEILQSQEYHHPEPCLEGVATLGDNITLVWHSNEIWLSEPRQPHAYPYRYRMTLDADVKIKRVVTMQNMAEADPYWYAIILTDGRPYIIRADKPEDARIIRIAREAPCLNPAGLCVYQEKIIFASEEGVFSISQNGVQNITAQYCTKEQYHTYNPRDLIMGVYDSRLVALRPDANGFMLNLNEGDSPYEKDFVELTARAVASDMYHLDLMIVGTEGTVSKWEKGANRMTAFWRSKDYVQSGLWHGTAGKVVSPMMRDVTGEGREYLSKFLADKKCRGHEDLSRFLIKNPEATPYIDMLANYSVEFFIYNDGSLFYSRPVATNRAFRIKRNNRRLAWGYAVRTQVPVAEIHIQTSKDDLTQEGGHA